MILSHVILWKGGITAGKVWLAAARNFKNPDQKQEVFYWRRQ
jgi:hypothetical protein